MAEKNVDDLDENAREVHIHLFRFARFVQYLKQYDAEIKLYNLPGENSITYKANPKNDGPSLESLIDTALQKDPGHGRDLLSRKLTAKDTHSNKERSKGLASILMGITIQRKSSKEDIGAVRLKDVHYKYCLRKNFFKAPKMSLKSNERIDYNPRLKKDVIDGKLKDVLKNSISSSTKDFVDKSYQYSGILLSEFPIFERHSKQLNNNLCQITNGGNPPSDIEEITNELLKLARVYNQIIDRHNIRLGIIPHYLDCSILSSSDMAGNALQSSYDGIASNIIRDSKSLSPEDRLFHRYEIMHKLVETSSEGKVKDWPAVFKALLIFCNFELSGLHSLLTTHLRIELKNIRFTVITKNSLDDKKSEKSRLTAEQLSEELRNYFISDPLDEMLKLRKGQLLSKPIFKYGEEAAIANHYNKFEILGRIIKISESILREKIISDLHMSDKFLPQDRESLFR